jgi:hypothetical protein
MMVSAKLMGALAACLVGYTESARPCTRLHVETALDVRSYLLGVSLSAELMSTLPIAPHAERCTWNCTIHPASQTALRASGVRDRDQDRARGQHAPADGP